MPNDGSRLAKSENIVVLADLPISVCTIRQKSTRYFYLATQPYKDRERQRERGAIRGNLRDTVVVRKGCHVGLDSCEY